MAGAGNDGVLMLGAAGAWHGQCYGWETKRK